MSSFKSSSEIRQAFIQYFEKQGHQFVPSSSLIPGNDPTLLFTNAGMVQFKDTFLGQEARPYTRAVSSQRCMRAGGKHNDLENVGYTARHHTFFEMLGNFSFGDYFKRDAIRYAWEFLTQVLGLPVERLWVTVFENDDEAAEIWLNEIGVAADRISRCGEKDNFWSMGDTGPCGPCTEIFYDHGPEVAGGPPGSKDADGDRYIEIWNLVFMQFNRDKQGTLHPLPKPSVDTGMGLERIAAVMQGVHSNYDIDMFQHIIQGIAQLGYHGDLNHPSLKVIADHIRACAFLISDGVIPGNEGRSYVLRRIIRRAIRHGHKLNLPIPFFSKLVQVLIDVMGTAYPELIEHQHHIERVLLREEEQFERTLDQGMRLLQEHIQKTKHKHIPGDVAFNLYDTYGFPLDLTADIAREHDLAVDMDGFNHHMQKQRTQSQSAHQFQANYAAVTQKLDVETSFQGYEHDVFDSKILALLAHDQMVKQVDVGQKVAVVLEDTPFYAESGGQVGDRGRLVGEDFVFRVDDTQSLGHAVLHHGELVQGRLKINQSVIAEVDATRRNAIRLNHTATHLLHAALKILVGTHVQQKGSLVDAHRARFDFSHTGPLTIEERQAVEKLVNQQIRANHSVDTKLMDIDSAKQEGALALFGEKYADEVRVLCMSDFSKELCGGTHAQRTGDIGLFKIVAEYGVASGVRRLEFVTGEYALAWVQAQLNQLDQIAVALKTQPENILEKIAQQAQSSKAQEKTIEQLRHKLTEANSGKAEVYQFEGYSIQVQRLEDDMGMQDMRSMLDKQRAKLDPAVLVLYTIHADKLNVVASVSKSMLGKMPTAVELVKMLCGKGGGREDMAQGGGLVPDDLSQREAEMKAQLKTRLQEINRP